MIRESSNVPVLISVRSSGLILFCSDVLAQIDHGEFEGFEYVNPLLMSKVDDV